MSVYDTDSAYLYLHDFYTPGKKRMNPTIEISTTVHCRMVRTTLALKSCIRPCQNGSNHSDTQVMQLAVSEWLEPFWHFSHVICMAVPEWLEPFWHSSSASAWHYLRARMARAILALPAIFECHNDSSHSGTAKHI